MDRTPSRSALLWPACCWPRPPGALALDPALQLSQYAHTAWTVRDGVFKGNIYAMAQTPDGYLWLGSEFGLYRFDGVRSIPWHPPEGQRLPEQNINSLLVTRDGTLWIGTFAGLATLRGGTLTLHKEGPNSWQRCSRIGRGRCGSARSTLLMGGSAPSETTRCSAWAMVAYSAEPSGPSIRTARAPCGPLRSPDSGASSLVG